MLPDVDDLLGTIRVVALPLVTRFRGIAVREAALLEGPEGWTEFAPFPEYDDAESARWLAAAIEYGWQRPPAARRTEITVNATVPAVPAAEVPGVLARFPGCRTAKVKVAEPGSSLDDDVARVRAARDVLGPEGRIRVDANAAWNVDEAERALRLLSPADLEYAEQPCSTVEELVDLRRRTKDLRVPIAADESIRRSADPHRAGAAVDVVIVKAAPLGGIESALGLARMLSRPAVVSSALDTSVGLGMGAHLAAALPRLPYDCGLGTAALLAADVTDDPLRPEGGVIPVRRVVPSLALLDRWSADAERTAWWADRLRRTHAALAG
ncbi:o-succinylbenzoate synthase [uncultured Amnibacterium sp.]|uniref:o-succinylbenzoate synthase n=1 Tax=uncultured Amnibacterium sp. TaxID=1631851 RepID=UPI0035CB96B8